MQRLEKNKKIAFLVHPRDLNDFYIRFPFFKFLPERISNFATLHFKPFIASKISGLKNKDKKEIPGYVIVVPLTAKQMLEHRELTVKRVEEALKLAEKKGVGIIAFGALTSSLTKGGLDVQGKTSVAITTGRAFTVKTVTDYVKEVIKEFELNKEKLTVAVVGAAGSIGMGCTYYLAEWGIKNFILVDLERKLNKVRSHIQKIEHNKAHVKITHHIQDIKEADIIVAATNAPEALIKADDLKPGAVIVNDAQPSDVDSEVYNRDDVIVIEGGIVAVEGMKNHINIGLKKSNHTYCCFGEAVILAYNGLYFDHSLGFLSLQNIEKLEKMSENINISLVPWQNMHGDIPKKKIEKVKTIINQK